MEILGNKVEGLGKDGKKGALRKGELILSSTLLTSVKDLALVQSFLSKPVELLMRRSSPMANTITKVVELRNDSFALKWLLDKLVFYGSNGCCSNSSRKKPRLLVDCETAVSNVNDAIEAQRATNTRQIIKDYQVIIKCTEMKEKITQPTRCKLCEEIVTLDQLADHSFKCFEKKTVYLELDKINKMVLKLRTTCSKTRTLLCSLR